MPAIFEIMFGGRMGGIAGGRRGQTRQTKIYYMIVYFYCFKFFRLVLKSKGSARLISNIVWLTDGRGGRRAAEPD